MKTEKKYQLPKEFAEKYLMALRSGNYKQNRSSLFDGECWCVTGIAYDVCGINRDLIKSSLYATDFFDKNDMNPVELGLVSELYDTDLEQYLMGLNDIDKKSFPEIADWIEENCQFI